MVKNYNKDSADPGYFLEVNNIHKNCNKNYNDLPLLPERRKLKRLKNV